MKSTFAIALLFASLTAASQEAPRWMRYPALSPDGSTIAFTYAGDLWLVPARGGTARSLTQHEAHDFMPVWSPDSKQLVFASDRHGNFDLFTISAEGGTAERLTYHSTPEYPYSFSADGKTVYFGAARMDAAANRQFPSGYMSELYSVPARGGAVRQVLTTPAEDVRFTADGKRMFYTDRKGGENTWRKHHQSAVARDLWMWEPGNGKHTRLTTFAGEDRNPVLTEGGNTVYFLSEASGTFNVHRMTTANPGAVTAVTQFTKHPVRFLTASDAGMLCFSYDGELYTQAPGAQPFKVPVAIRTERKSNNERLLPVSGGVRDLAVAPSGKEVAYIHRGEVFVTSVEGGTTKRITNTPEAERTPSFSPDGRSLLYASERGGGWKVFQASLQRGEEPYFFASTLVTEKPLIANEHENYQPEFSPDGKEVAFVEDRNILKVLNLSTGRVRTLLTTGELFSMSDNDQYFTWSPDGRYLLFEYTEPGFANGEVGMIAADGKGKKINLTESGFQDFSPKWTAGSRMLIWNSTREGLRAAAATGGAQADVYALFLTQDAWDRFRLTKEEAGLLKEMEDKDSLAKKSKSKKDTVNIDWEGLKYRRARLTLHSSALADALVSKDGEHLYYLARFEKGFNLWSTNLRTKETKMLAPLNASSARMLWDKDAKNLFLLADGRIIKMDPASAKQETVSVSGDLPLDVAAERAFMFDHVVRRTSKTFYTAGYHGAKWDDLRKDYERYLPHISNNWEFSEMLSELLGELNVSHSGASFFSAAPTGDATASLGVIYDPAHRGAGLRIAEVLAEGPLMRAGFGIRPGTIIEKIDGVTIEADSDPARYLNRKAGKTTLLTLLNTDGTRRDLTVKPVSLGEENGLLYRRWVRRNAEEVDRLSNGQLGYVHIPGMNDGAYRNFYEEAMGKYAGRKALVVDTRNNGGGDLVADLSMFLSGKRFFDYTTDTRSAGFEPNFRWTKPSIALANEGNYSDGHCFAFSYQDLKLGKLVGAPVPGTCTFAGWETLQDGSLRWGVPPLGVKDVNGKYLENWQTMPDILVQNDYESVSSGRDPQLEAAVKELLKEVK